MSKGKWKPINTAPENTPILLKFYRGNKGISRRSDQFFAVEGCKVSHSNHVRYLDYLDRLLWFEGSKTSRNYVAGWQELPEGTKDENS